MNKKLLFIAGLLLVTIFALFSYTSKQHTEEAKQSNGNIKIAATIFPIYDIAQTVADDLADVKLILQPGASPHTFEPTPSELTKLQGTKAIFSIGQGLDEWTTGIANNIRNAKVIELDKDMKLRKYEEGDDHDDHDEHEEDHDDHHDEHEDEDEHDHDHGEFDPHYWLAPDNAVLMANKIAKELGNIDPANKNAYEKNAKTFAKALENKNAEWDNTLKKVKTRELVTFHNAFSYFAHHFDLEILTTFEPFPGKEPTPSYLQELRHTIEEHDITALFTEPQLHGASLEQFAKDNDISVSVLDPIGGTSGRDSYIELIDYNVETVVKALK